ncbi:MAG: PEP-CTERM sorting domain-containing protein [Terriglobales bacterium]
MNRIIQLAVLVILSATVLMAAPAAKPKTNTPVRVPEPASLVLLASGLALLAGRSRKA